MVGLSAITKKWIFLINIMNKSYRDRLFYSRVDTEC